MKRISIIGLLIIAHCTLLIVNCSAQSLETLINEALENNPELKVLENEYFAALEKAPQVNQLPDPEAGVGGFVLPVETRLGAQTFRISATQMFPWFGTLEASQGLEKAKARAVYERIAVTKLNLTYETRQAYYQLYEIQESQAIIRRNIKILDALERLALAKVESGKASAADVLRVQLKTEALNQELEILKNAQRKPQAEINRLLNRPLNTPVNIDEKFSFVQIPYDQDTLKSVIRANHPALRMFELQQEISRQSMIVNELDGKPSFGLGLDYIAVNERKDSDPAKNGRDILQLRASVKIPIYRKKYEAKDREENFRIMALDHQKEHTLNLYLTAIEKAFIDFESARLKMSLFQKQIELTKAAINILETEYSTKGNNFDELLQLEKELIDYDLKILKAILQSHLAKNNIERFLY